MFIPCIYRLILQNHPSTETKGIKQQQAQQPAMPIMKTFNTHCKTVNLRPFVCPPINLKLKRCLNVDVWDMVDS